MEFFMIKVVILNKINSNKYIISKVFNKCKINNNLRIKSEIKIDTMQLIKRILIKFNKLYQIPIISISNINKMIQILFQIPVLKIIRITTNNIMIKISLI